MIFCRVRGDSWVFLRSENRGSALSTVGLTIGSLDLNQENRVSSSKYILTSHCPNPMFAVVSQFSKKA